MTWPRDAPQVRYYGAMLANAGFSPGWVGDLVEDARRFDELRRSDDADPANQCVLNALPPRVDVLELGFVDRLLGDKLLSSNAPAGPWRARFAESGFSRGAPTRRAWIAEHIILVHDVAYFDRFTVDQQVG